MEKVEKVEKPEHIRVGCIEVTLWQNEKFSTVTMQRSYKDRNGSWQKAKSLGVRDIPKAILALEKAYEKLALRMEG